MRAVEVFHFKECVRAAEKRSGSLRMARAGVDYMKGEDASLATMTEQAKVERETLAVCIHEQKGRTTTQDAELAVVVRCEQEVTGCLAAGEERANTAGSWPCRRFEKMSKL